MKWIYIYAVLNSIIALVMAVAVGTNSEYGKPVAYIGLVVFCVIYILGRREYKRLIRDPSYRKYKVTMPWEKEK